MVELPDVERIFKLAEVEQITGLARSTLYRKLREGTLFGRKISNGTWRIPRAEVDRLLGEPVTGPIPRV